MILSPGPLLEVDTDLMSVSTSETLRDTTRKEEEVVQSTGHAPALKTLDEVERDHISAVLLQTRGVIEGAKGAAKTLGMHPNTLRHRMEKLGIKRSPTAYRSSPAKG